MLTFYWKQTNKGHNQGTTNWLMLLIPAGDDSWFYHNVIIII